MPCLVRLIVAHVAERSQVFLYVLASLRVVLNVMQFHVARIRWIPFVLRPTALLAFVLVAAQNFPAHVVGNVPVVLETLPISL